MIGGGEEVVAKLVVEHDEALAVQMFAREQFAAISAMAPGTSVAFGVQVQPCMGLVWFLVARDEVVATVDGEGRSANPLPERGGHAEAWFRHPCVNRDATEPRRWRMDPATSFG